MTHAIDHIRRRSRRGLPLFVFLLVTAGVLDSRSSAQVFRSAVTVGVLDVIVTDPQGRSVPDLTKSDFEVTDEGERRDIVSVSFVSIPSAPSRAPAAAPSDVFTNSTDLASRRVFVIVLDDLNTASQDTMRTRAAVKTILEALPDGDFVAVVHTGQQTGAQEFTSDKGRLLGDLTRFVGRRPMRFEDTDNVPPSERPLADPDTLTEHRQNLRRVLDTLQNVAAWLAPLEGRRKAVLYVTAGLPADLAHAFTDSRTANADFRRLITVAMQANVAIYPVDARGLASPDDPDNSAAALWALANDTGGIATINTNDLGRAIAVAVRDSSAYYLVGYSLSQAKNGRSADPRHVVVRALRPGLTVRTRLLSASGPAHVQDRRSIASLVASPLAGGRIPVALHAASFAAAGGKARVLATLEFGADAVAFAERSGKMAASLQYRIVVSDVTGWVAASESRTLEFHVSETRRDQMRDSRTRLISSFDLAPGSYRIRAAVLDAGNGEHGTAAGDLDVPRYGRALSMSTIEVASTAEAHTPTMRANVLVFETRLSSAPTTVRTFGRGDTLDAFAEAYTMAAADHVDATATVFRASGGRIDQRPLTVAREKGIGGAQCYGLRTRVPLTELEPGNYTLTIAVRTPQASTERSVPFVMR